MILQDFCCRSTISITEIEPITDILQRLSISFAQQNFEFITPLCRKHRTTDSSKHKLPSHSIFEILSSLEENKIELWTCKLKLFIQYTNRLYCLPAKFVFCAYNYDLLSTQIQQHGLKDPGQWPINLRWKKSHMYYRDSTTRCTSDANKMHSLLLLTIYIK